MLKSLACWMFITLASFGASADEVSADDAHAVRAVVEAQLAAMAVGNPTQAFAFASPAIQSRFRDAGAFMDMVRRSYPMIVNPASISFSRPEANDGAILQGVQFRDREGNYWQAVYELERQPDKTWRINGCAVAPDDESSTT